MHAIDEQAAAFYRSLGFRPSPFSASTLMLVREATSLWAAVETRNGVQPRFGLINVGAFV